MTTANEPSVAELLQLTIEAAMRFAEGHETLAETSYLPRRRALEQALRIKAESVLFDIVPPMAEQQKGE